MARILIAEDESDIRDLIVFTLQFEGHEVHPYSNGADAAENAAKVMPDVIIMDVRMPRMTGYEACEAIRADEKTKHIPVMFLSAKGQETEIEQGIRAGANDYMLKPFDMPQLIEKVDKLLKAHKSAPAKEVKPDNTAKPAEPSQDAKPASSPTEAKKDDQPGADQPAN